MPPLLAMNKKNYIPGFSTKRFESFLQNLQFVDLVPSS